MIAFDYCHLDFAFENSDGRQAHAWEYTPTDRSASFRTPKGIDQPMTPTPLRLWEELQPSAGG
jgi:hypothetical protein